MRAAGADFVRSLVDQIRSAQVFGARWRKRASDIDFSDYTDETIGGILRGMRTTIGVTRSKLARSFGTTEEIIEQLEDGYVPTIGSWPEAARIVTCYGEALEVDTHPILVRLNEHARRYSPRQRRTVERATAPAPRRQPMPEAEADIEAPRERPRRKHRLLLTISAPLVVAMGAAWISQAAMPKSVARPVMASIMNAVSYVSPRLDGLRWIDVSDPRTRKADRLVIGAR
jgi:hypothetical protein